VSRQGRCHSDPRATADKKKLDVIDYATDLLGGKWSPNTRFPAQTRRAAASALAAGPAAAVFTRRTILLILPSLRSWAASPKPSSYQGWILRGFDDHVRLAVCRFVAKWPGCLFFQTPRPRFQGAGDRGPRHVLDGSSLPSSA